MLFKNIPFFYVNIEEDTFLSSTDKICTTKIHPCFNALDTEVQDKFRGLINKAVRIIRDNCKENLFEKHKKFALIYVSVNRKKFKEQKEGSCLSELHPCYTNLEEPIQEDVTKLLNEAIDTFRNNIEFKDL